MSKFIHLNEWFELCIISQENKNAGQHTENQINDLAQYYPYETILFHNRLFFLFLIFISRLPNFEQVNASQT